MKKILSLLLSILLLFVSTCTNNNVSVYADDNLEDEVIEVVENEGTPDDKEVEVVQDDSTTVEEDVPDVDDTSNKEDSDELVEAEKEIILDNPGDDLNYDYNYSKPLIFEKENGDLVLKYDNPEIMTRLAAGDDDFGDNNYAEIWFTSNGSVWYPIRYNPNNLVKYTLSDDLKTLVIPNYYLLTSYIKNGVYEVRIKVSDYDDIDLEDVVIISSGVKSAPDLEDISITSGNTITLTCNNSDWLEGIVKPTKIAFDERDYYYYNIEEGGWIRFFSLSDGSIYHFDNTYNTYVDWTETYMLLSGNSITIPRDVIVESAMADGVYEVTISSFGHETIYNFEVDITTGVQEAEAEVSYDNGNILITSENTNWISKLCEPNVNDNNGVYKGSESYIYLVNDDGSKYYYFDNYVDNSDSSKDIIMYYVLDENTVIIPEETLLEKRVATGHYHMGLNAEDFPYIGKEIDYVSTAKSVPNDIEVYFEEGKGVVIKSGNNDYLNKLTETGINRPVSEVGLKEPQELDRWISFSNMKYDDVVYQELIKDGDKVIINLDVIKSASLVEGDYEIKLSAYGYDEYISSVIHVKTADSVPTDLDVYQSKGDLIINSADKEFLRNTTIVRIERKYVGAYHFPVEYNTTNKYLVVKSHSLKEMGVIDGYYDIIVRSTGNVSKKDVYITNTPYKYSVTFNANGGKGKMNKITNLISGMGVNIPKNEFTRKGYNFAGWSTKKNENVEQSDGYLHLFAKKNNEAKTLYAVWRPILVEEINITSSQTLLFDQIYVVGGKTVKLTASTEPKEVANSAVTWSLVNPEDSRYATISSSGVVTAKKVDTIQTVGIVATAKDGSKVSETKQIIIFPATEKVIIKNSDDSADVTGQTINVDPEDKNEFYLYARTEKPTLSEYTWKSSNTKLATVNENGEVRIIGSKGTVKITATAKDGTNKSSSVTFNIAKKVRFIIESGPSKVVAGKSIKLSVDVNPEDAANKAIIWSLVNSEDSQFATLSSSGTFTAKKIGVGKIVEVKAVSKEDPEGEVVKPVSFFVEIIPGIEKMELLRYPDQDTNYAGQTIVVDPQDEETYYFEVKFDPETADQDLDWSSSNTKLATVNSAGDVHIIGNKGTVKITAKATDGSNKSVSVNLKIEKKVQSINIVADKPALADDEVAKGKTLKLKAEIEPIDATNKSVTWSLVNPEKDSQFVTISSSGVVTAKKVNPNDPDYDELHKVEVMAKAKDGSGTFRTKTIIVLPLSTGISMYMDNGGLIGTYVSGADIDVGKLSGETINLYSITDPYDASNKANWTTSDKSIATVQDRKVTFTGKKGKVKITAKAADGSGKSTSVYFNNINIGTVTISFLAQNKSKKWVDGSKTLPNAIMSRLTNDLKKQNIHAGEDGHKPEGIEVDTKIAGYVCIDIVEKRNGNNITYEYLWEKLD